MTIDLLINRASTPVALRAVTLARIGGCEVLDTFKSPQNLGKKKPRQVAFEKNLTLKVLSKLYGNFFHELDKLTADYIKLPVERFIPNNDSISLSQIYRQTTFSEKINNIKTSKTEPTIFVFDFDNTLFPSHTKTKEELQKAIEDFALLQEHCRLNNVILVLATGQTQAGFNSLLAKYHITLSGVDVISDGTASRMSFRLADDGYRTISDYNSKIKFNTGEVHPIIQSICQENSENGFASLVNGLAELDSSKELSITKQDGLDIYDKFISYITYATKVEVESIVEKIKEKFKENNIDSDISIGIAAEGNNKLPEIARNHWFINIQPKGIDGKLQTREFMLDCMIKNLPEELGEQIKCVIAGDSNNDAISILNPTQKEGVKTVNIAVNNSTEAFLKLLRVATQAVGINENIRQNPQNPNAVYVFPEAGLIQGIIEADTILKGLTTENLLKQVSSD